ncbi:MAG: hypothetical protein LUH82_01570 [Clostridiales bacterium]|nr:hypothetical protein [Clostridiales bacterium]
MRKVKKLPLIVLTLCVALGLTFTVFAAELGAKTVLTAVGDDYTVAVSFNDEAGLPADTELSVSEYAADSQEYLERSAEAAQLYEYDGEFEFRLFNISLSSNGQEVEPSAGVEVVFSFQAVDSQNEAQYAVTHYTNGEIYEIAAETSLDDGVQNISFCTDSFSDYGIAIASTEDQGDIGSELDGDYAYLTDVGMTEDSETESGYSMRTGSSPWDSEEGAGNDTTDADNVLRTFDAATYTVTFTSTVRNDAPYQTYYQGNLYFEFILQGDSTESRFEEERMTWLSAKNAVYIITEEEIDGVTCQVLRGYYLWTPASGNTHAIGASTQELTLAIRALAMKNGDTIQPTFTFWLEGNEVGVDYSNWGTADYAGGVVTGNSNVCATHGETEYFTINTPAVTISAIANYNVSLTGNSAYGAYSYLSTYDFSTGTSLALDSDAGTVYGRLNIWGINLQIRCKESGSGLRGVELPKEGEEITFTLTLTSSYTYTNANGKSTTVTFDSDSAYAPLVWAFDENSTAQSKQDRDMPDGIHSNSAQGGVYNTIVNNNENRSAYDGGDWSAVKNADGTLTVSVTNYQINAEHIPSSNVVSGNSGTTYYNPSTISGYWDIDTWCFSCGEIVLVQPFYSYEYDENGNLVSSTYIADEYGTGSFTTKVQDTSLQMTSLSGATLDSVDDNSNQARTNDDLASITSALAITGSITQPIVYKAYYATWNTSETALTSGCQYYPKDWVLQSGKLSIYSTVSMSNGEMEYQGAAADVLIKFDDAFFVPDGTIFSRSSSYTTYVWAAKADGTGWDHGGLSPGEDGYDEEMIMADIDDLVYFSSLSALQDAGYTCVGVLAQRRAGASEFYLRGSVNPEAEAGQVYMVSACGTAWRIKELAAATDEYTQDEIIEMDSDELAALAAKVIPLRTTIDGAEESTDEVAYAASYADYPTAAWYNGGEDGTSSTSNYIRNYVKASYDENGYVYTNTVYDGGSSAYYYYGDSCLVLGYNSGVSISTLQTSGGGSVKTTYDMDTNQRIVDYALSGTITTNAYDGQTGSDATTTVTMTVTLPDGLTYIEGSSYIGGTYASNGEGVQGTVTDGTQLSENGSVTYTAEDGAEITVTLTVQVSTTDDGSGNTTTVTTLVYTLSGVTVPNSTATTYLDEICFSAQIGTPGIESTDVQDGDVLTVSAEVYGSGDYMRAISTANGNYDSTDITVSKNAAVSLAKFADQSVVDVGSGMGFTLYIENNSAGSMSLLAVEGLPYQNDGASSFTGTVYVTEFTILSSGTADLSNITFYYTTDASYNGAGSADLESEDFTDSTVWSELVIDSSTGEAELPADFEPALIVAVGTLGAGESLQMHITLYLPQAVAGDYIVNNLSRGNLSSSARCRVVNRTLSGMTWFDADGDGIYDSGEEAMSGVSVMLLKLNDGNEYEAVCYSGTETPVIIETGYQIDLVSASSAQDAQSYTQGNFLFDNLSAGTYALMFYSGTTDISGYVASPVNEGADDALDSDASAVYSGYSLSYTMITDIDMPDASELTYSTYASTANDSGFFLYNLTVSKIDAVSEAALSGVSFAFEKLMEVGGELVTDASVQYAEQLTDESGKLAYESLSAGVYRLTETQATDGYYLLDSAILITVDTDGTITAAAESDSSTVYTASASGSAITLTVPNAPGAMLPAAGGSGILEYILPGALLSVGGLVLILIKKQRGRRTA